MGAYVRLSTTTLTSATANFTLSSIPSGYTDLRVVFGNLKTTPGAGTIVLRFNGDSGSNYSRTNINGDGAGTTASSAQFTSVTWIHLNGGNTSTTIPGMVTLDIPSYSSTSINKTVLAASTFDFNGSGNMTYAVGLWRSTAAISSISILMNTGDNFAIGTTATVYGIKES